MPQHKPGVQTLEAIHATCSVGGAVHGGEKGRGEEGNPKQMAVTSSLLDRLQRIVGTCKRLCFLSRNIPETPLQLTMASYGVLMWSLDTCIST